MTEPIINILRLIFIGTATTIVRIIGQLAIPTGEQTVLSPSIFAQNGTMPVAFTIYGIFAYSLIAALFLLIRKRTGGNRIWQGLRYGFACCAVWIVYLWEPLPHVAPLGSHHLSCGGRPGSHRHGAAAGLAVRANKAACKKSAVGSCPPFPDLS